MYYLILVVISFNFTLCKFLLLHVHYFSDACFLPMDEGECSSGHNDNSHKYYYDKSKGKCLLFRYSGCGGNDNRFNDERACKQACVIFGKY